MGFRSDISRVPVFGLGCAGGASGLSIASRLAQARPGTNILLVTVELCSLALRLDELTKANIIATSLFADGAAALLLRAGDGGETLIEATGEHLWPDTLDVMGWNVDPLGFGVILRRTIPEFVTTELKPALTQVLGRMKLKLADIDKFICHPGGAKVDRRDRDRAVARSGHAGARAAGDRRLRQHVGADGAVHPRTLAGEGLAAALALDRARPRLHRKLRLAAARGVTAAEIILALVTAQRGAELVLSRSNTRALMARGAIEVAPVIIP